MASRLSWKWALSGVALAGAALLLSGGDDEPRDPNKPNDDDNDDDDGDDMPKPMKKRPPKVEGDAAPQWPLQGDAARKITDDVGNCRPRRACVQGRPERHHAGEDLLAPRGTVIVATEDGELVKLDPEWYDGSGSVLLQTDSGPVINFGEVEPNSWEEFGHVEGAHVSKGDPIARVGRHRQLHFEMYANNTRKTSRWMWGKAPPASLRDPVPYLRLAACSGDEGKQGCMRETMSPKQVLWAKLRALPQLDEDQRLFLMLVAFGETAGTWKPTAHNDTPSEVKASVDAWDAAPKLAAALEATGHPRESWTIGSGGYGGRLGPYFGDDMLDAELDADPRLLFDGNHSIVSSIITAHKLQRLSHWQRSPQTMGALRAGYFGLAAMVTPPVERLEKYKRHAEQVGLPADFIERKPAIFPGPEQGAALLATLEDAKVA